jgi:uncharacterized protein (DUF2461 family)
MSADVSRTATFVRRVGEDGTAPRGDTVTAFDGYPEGTLALLAEMPGWTRDDYATRKPEVGSLVIDPSKAFVEAMIPALHDKVSPGLTGVPKINGSISPMNNDVRFSKGKDLYKDHVLMWFWEGGSKKTGAKVAVRIHPEGVGFGVGMPFTPDQLERWRGAIDDDATGVPFAEAVARIEAQGDTGTMGDALKRVPKPYDADHPRGDLLRHKGFQIHWQEDPPEALHSAGLVGWCGDRLATAADIHRFFAEHVA